MTERTCTECCTLHMRPKFKDMTSAVRVTEIENTSRCMNFLASINQLNQCLVSSWVLSSRIHADSDESSPKPPWIAQKPTVLCQLNRTVSIKEYAKISIDTNNHSSLSSFKCGPVHFDFHALFFPKLTSYCGLTARKKLTWEAKMRQLLVNGRCDISVNALRSRPEEENDWASISTSPGVGRTPLMNMSSLYKWESQWVSQNFSSSPSTSPSDNIWVLFKTCHCLWNLLYITKLYSLEVLEAITTWAGWKSAVSNFSDSEIACWILLGLKRPENLFQYD